MADRDYLLQVVAHTMNLLEKHYGVVDMDDLGGITADEIAEHIRGREDYCVQCIVPEHETCSLGECVHRCQCCADTQAQMLEEEKLK